MGAKTGLLAFTDGDLPAALRRATLPDRDEMAELVRRVLPGYGLEYAGTGRLGDAVYPSDEVIFATTIGATTVLGDQRFMIEHPSKLPAHLVDLAAGRQIVLHAMHSVSDWFAFAVWEHGALVRSLSLAPDEGIIENIGEPLDFELPYWAGEHPMAEYPLPFHSLELGEEALRALFGFALEGNLEETDVDPYEIPLQGFRAIDPSGAEQAARERLMELVRQMP